MKVEIEKAKTPAFNSLAIGDAFWCVTSKSLFMRIEALPNNHCAANDGFAVHLESGRIFRFLSAEPIIHRPNLKVVSE